MPGIRQPRDVPPAVKGIAQILERRAAFDRLQAREAIVLRVIGIGGGGAIAQGEGAGLARCIAATLAHADPRDEKGRARGSLLLSGYAFG